MARGGRVAFAVIASIAGAALLWWYVQRVGVDRVMAGFATLGVSGMIVIVGLSVARFVVRAAAWIVLIGQSTGRSVGRRPPFWRVFDATVVGDALGNLLPVGPLVSEPAKALYIADVVPVQRGLAALIAETFFYSISITIYMLFGAAAMVEAFDLPAPLRLAGVWTIVAMAAGLGACAWIAWRKPSVASAVVSRLPGKTLGALAKRTKKFEAAAYDAGGGQGVPVGRVMVYQGVFHALSFAEAWFTLYLLTGRSLPLEAFVLDAFGRVSNVIFRVIPLRLGVDQAGSGLVSQAIGLGPAIGTTLSLIRTARVLLFAVFGLGLLGVRTWQQRKWVNE